MCAKATFKVPPIHQSFFREKLANSLSLSTHDSKLKTKSLSGFLNLPQVAAAFADNLVQTSGFCISGFKNKKGGKKNPQVLPNTLLLLAPPAGVSPHPSPSLRWTRAYSLLLKRNVGAEPLNKKDFDDRTVRCYYEFINWLR